MLNLLNRPREYIQLNRDTTVQTLTLQPTVREGVIVYDDSPLVQAAKSGNILVVDEADKAPTNVTCILKSLVESQEMILSDGRRIVPSQSTETGPNIIHLHPPLNWELSLFSSHCESLGSNNRLELILQILRSHLRTRIDSALASKRSYGNSRWMNLHDRGAFILFRDHGSDHGSRYKNEQKRKQNHSISIL